MDNWNRNKAWIRFVPLEQVLVFVPLIRIAGTKLKLEQAGTIVPAQDGAWNRGPKDF